MRNFIPTVSTVVKPWLCVCVFALALALGVVASAQPQTASQQPSTTESVDPGDSPTIRAGVTLVRTDVIVRDENGVFLSDLSPEDFIVEEDGVLQEVVSLVLVNGGRVYNQLLPPAPVQEGIILPNTRRANDTAGRIIIFFVDLMHLETGLTPQLRHFIKRVGDVLIHDGDLMGLISNGPGGTGVDLTYDRALLYATANRLMGSGFTPRELIFETAQGPGGSGELQWRAHRAFWTVHQLLENLDSIEDRRKVILYVSSGYDVNPFELQRLHRDSRSGSGFYGDSRLNAFDRSDDLNPILEVQRQGTVFADGQLLGEMVELTDAANRSNTTFYTIDPRGLVSGPDIDHNVTLSEWSEYVQTTRSSLRSLAELTGGMSIVNTNNFDELLREIDAETSDYYVLGYYTSNTDTTDRIRELDITVNRENATVRSREFYALGR